MAEEQEETVIDNPDPHFEPLVHLPPVDITTLEEEEDVMAKLRAKLFRYDASSEPPEWKERGLGDVKILKHKKSGTCRVLMRRDKTHKVCANHYVLPYMELKPNCGSDRAWVWSTPADFADEEAQPELLAIRFANAENAQNFKKMFLEAQEIMKDKLPLKGDRTEDAEGGDKEDVEEKKEEEPEEEKEAAADQDQEEKATADEIAEKLEELTVKDGQKGDAESKVSESVEKKKETDS